MRRPTRTRRLSIAAIVSLLAFVVLATAGVRSLRTLEKWSFKSWRGVELIGGRVIYWHWHGKSVHGEAQSAGHESQKLPSTEFVIFWNFEVFDKQLYPELRDSRLLQVCVPLWPFLLLLLIAPVRWLIARPANAPAFPVITDAKQELA